ncbi:MAG: hypothetical protein Q4E22_05745 [Coriobacteriia bacterium]|nr:hypothetical protein [Coriobacteriia bacterium]
MLDSDKKTYQAPRHLLVLDSYAHRSNVEVQSLVGSMGMIPLGINLGDLMEEFELHPSSAQDSTRHAMKLIESIKRNNRRAIFVLQVPLAELSLDEEQFKLASKRLAQSFKQILQSFPDVFMIMLSPKNSLVPQAFIDEFGALDVVQVQGHAAIKKEIALRILTSGEELSEPLNYYNLARWASSVDSISLVKAYTEHLKSLEEASTNEELSSRQMALSNYDLYMLIYQAMNEGPLKTQLGDYMAQIMLKEINI